MKLRFSTPPWFWLITLLLSWQPGPGCGQTARWVKLATSTSDADFLRLLHPQQHGLAVPELAQLTQWSGDAQVTGDSLYRLLRSWQHYPKPRRTGIICRYEVKLDSTHTVPYLVYVPQHYDHRLPTKLLVYYKGGWLNRKQLPANYAKEIVLDNPTFRYLDEQNTIELFPCLRQDLAIYGNYGYQHLQQMIAQTKRVLNIDDNRVYLSGFSDGGKTVFNVASLTPSAFAGFYAINGGLASRPQFLNLAARPLLAFIAQADELISPASVLAYAEQARHFGADWQVRRLPARTHYYAPYQQEVLPALFAHLTVVSRNPFPTRVTYAKGYNSSDLPGLDWVQCRMSSTKAPAATHQVDSIRVVNMAGEASRYRNGEKDGQVRATCFNNTYTVETSLVDELTLYISPVMVDLTQPIRVVVNGQQRYQGMVTYSKNFLGQRFAANFDRQQLFINELTIKL